MAYKRKPKRAKESGKLDTTPKKKPEDKPEVKESNFEAPIEKAMGMRRVPGGWILITYEFQDGKVINEICTQPDPKNVTLERYKINFYKLFIKE